MPARATWARRTSPGARFPVRRATWSSSSGFDPAAGPATEPPLLPRAPRPSMARSPRRADRARAVALKRVAVLAKPGSREGARIARELGAWLAARGLSVRFDQRTSKAIGRPDGIEPETLPPRTDLCVVAGGDGTLL